MKVRYKVWLEDGSHLFGDGAASLLQAIDELGSINRAAARLNMSYRQAWGHIRKVEERMGIPLLETRVGGEHGGGSQLTPAARELLQKYQLFKKRVNDSIQQIFHQVFGE